jgi:hypothetical protein
VASRPNRVIKRTDSITVVSDFGQFEISCHGFNDSVGFFMVNGSSRSFDCDCGSSAGFQNG